MKYGLIALVVAILGIGEYAFVEFYPLSPAQRIRRMDELPVVRQVIGAQEYRMVKQSFDADSGGIKTLEMGGISYTWSSAKSLVDDARSGDRNARSMIGRIKFSNKVRASLDEHRRLAESGNIFDLMAYYTTSQFAYDKTDSVRAAQMLSQHPSALAKWSLTMQFKKDLNWYSKEVMLLRALISRENLLQPNLTDEYVNRITDYNNQFVASIREKAEQGEEDAIWVVEQLDATPIESAPTER